MEQQVLELCTVGGFAVSEALQLKLEPYCRAAEHPLPGRVQGDVDGGDNFCPEPPGGILLGAAPQLGMQTKLNGGNRCICSCNGLSGSWMLFDLLYSLSTGETEYYSVGM